MIGSRGYNAYDDKRTALYLVTVSQLKSLEMKGLKMTFYVFLDVYKRQIVGFRWKSNYYIRARAAKVSNPRTPKQQECPD